ncbi:hypothetical protein ACJX0J_017081, partial [Zea mays]
RLESLRPCLLLSCTTDYVVSLSFIFDKTKILVCSILCYVLAIEEDFEYIIQVNSLFIMLQLEAPNCRIGNLINFGALHGLNRNLNDSSKLHLEIVGFSLFVFT